MSSKSKDWIQGMNLQEGAFSAKARSAGKSVPAYTSEVIKRFKGKKGLSPEDVKTLRQAVLARTLVR